MSQTVTEATTVLEASAIEGQPSRLLIGIITPGQGSSGFYPADVLEAAATDKVFPAGTQMFFDHPTESDNFERPERSVRDLAAVLSEDARWDGSKLVAEASVFGPYRDLLSDAEFSKAIGVSIRASAEVKEGKNGREITRLVHAESVDFVTKAGRGGSILQVLESARPSKVNDRAVHRGVSEATVNDRREALSSLVREEYSDEKTYVWLRDFDETYAWFDVESGEDSGTWQQTYSTGDDELANALTGDRIEVRAVTTYVPVDPVGQFNTQESSGGHMATTQIEESALSELREKAGRVTALESERDTAVKERDEATEKVATLEGTVRESRIATIIAEADVTFDDLQVAGLTAGAPVKEGVLDEDAFKKTVAEAAAKIAEAGGAGTVKGFGGNTSPVDKTEQDLRESNDKHRAAIFGRPIKEA
jgi:hypothetical protein